MRCIDLYFDFISPYSWMLLVQVEEFAKAHDVQIRLRPIVFGALLTKTGLVGPMEQDQKRQYSFVDVKRCAAALDLPFEGPPAHPFRSLDALRLATTQLDGTMMMPLCLALMRACWEQGRDLTDITVLADVAKCIGLPTADLAAKINDPQVKTALRTATEQALAAGVFGVPTLDYGGELFWGHDRLSHLGDMLRSGRAPILAPDIQRFLDRPRGADRRR